MAEAAAQKEDSARQAELSLLSLSQPPQLQLEPEPEPVRQVSTQDCRRQEPAAPAAAVRKEMVVGPAAGGKKKRRKKAKKKRGKRVGKKGTDRLPRIEGAFLGSVVVEESPETRLMARREQRKAIEAKRPWRQPMPPMAKPVPSATLRVLSPRRGGFGSSSARKVMLPVPKPPPASQPKPLPPPASARQKPVPPKASVAQRAAPKRYKHVDHGLPYMKNIKQIMTAKKLLAMLKELNTQARQYFVDSDLRVANARAAAKNALNTAEQLGVVVEQRQAEVDAAEAELARQEEEARQAQNKLIEEVAEAEAAEQAASREVQEAEDAEARAAAAETEAYTAAAEAAREKNRAAEAKAAAAAAAEEAAEKEHDAVRAKAEQDAAEQAVAEAEHLLELGVSPATGKKLKKQEKIEAAEDLAAKREHLLQRAPSSRVSDDQIKEHEARLREAEEQLNSAAKKQRKQLADDVRRKQAALQKHRSEAVTLALDQAAMTRSLAAEARARMELVLQAADAAQAVADRKAAAAAAARELARSELQEMVVAQSAAVKEREEAAAAAAAAQLEAEDVEHAKMMLDTKIALLVKAQTKVKEAQAEVLRLIQLAEDRAAQSAVIPPISLVDQDPDKIDYDSEDGESIGQDCPGDYRPVADMRSFVVELLDNRLEQLCLPEDEPFEFVKIKEPLRCCIAKCQEGIDLLGFDATAQHPAWSHEIDTARADFQRLRAVCQQKMINGLMLLANQQLIERHGDSRALQDCLSSCDEALVLCGGEHEPVVTETTDPPVEISTADAKTALHAVQAAHKFSRHMLSRSQGESKLMQRFRERRRAQIEHCRELAQKTSRATQLREAGREKLRLNDVRAAIALSEAVLLDPDDKEAARLLDEALQFVDEKKRVAAEKADIERRQAEAALAREKVKKVARGSRWLDEAHNKAVQNLEVASAAAEQARLATDPAYAAGTLAAAEGAWAGPAGASAARSAAAQAYRDTVKSGMGVDLATQAATAAGNAAAQAIAGGLAEAASMAGQQAAAQLLETMAREKHEKKENEWQEQKNANMKTAIAEYKRQVASLSEALRNQAEDAKETLGFAASTAERVEELQAEAQVREAAFEEELHAVQTQVADARKEVAHGREEIRRLEQELKNAKSAAEFFVGQAKGADEDADGNEGSLAHELQVKAANDARKKLEALKVVALHKKAVSSGLELDSIDAAMESEDPKQLLVDMLLAAQRQKAEAAFMKVLFA